MTTFAVFGMSSTRAVELAREEVPNEVPQPDGSTVLLLVLEWEALVQDTARRTFDSQRTVRLSPMYDAPAFARDFLTMARKDGARHLSIRARQRIDNELVWTELPPEQW